MEQTSSRLIPSCGHSDRQDRFIKSDSFYGNFYRMFCYTNTRMVFLCCQLFIPTIYVEVHFGSFKRLEVKEK